MRTFTLHRTTRLNVNINEAWRFFSDPHNLSKITPSSMKFTVLTKDLPAKIYTGLLIEYTVAPLFNIPVRWVTEIKEVEHPGFFADEQKSGPYTYWRHEHSFVPDGNTTIMQDKVMYSLPLGFLGTIAHSLVVKKKLAEIFGYREKVICGIFPGSTVTA